MIPNESNTTPAPDAVPDTGTAGPDRSTATCDESATNDRKLRAQLRVMMAQRLRALAEASEYQAIADMHKGLTGEYDALLAMSLQHQADSAKANAEALALRIDELQRFATVSERDVIDMAQSLIAGVAGHDLAVLYVRTATNTAQYRKLVGDLLTMLRRMHADMLNDEPPTARITIDVGHDDMHFGAALHMGATFTASRHFQRAPTGGWFSTETDFAAREVALPPELAEFIDAIDLPAKVADLLPRRRAGTHTAERAAEAKALASR